MTISSTTRIAGPFIGAGTTATFPFAFKVFDATDLTVLTLNVSTGAIAQLTLDSDYSATLNADQDANPGGSISLLDGNLATGLTLTITTDIAALQGLALTNGGGFYPDVINSALDLLTILLQQLSVQAGRALQIPLVDAATTVTLPPAAERAGKLLMFDSSGNPTLVPMAPGSGVPGAQSAGGTVDGVNATFTFAAGTATTPTPMVFAGGVFQSPVTDYGVPVSLGGGLWRIVFTNPPTTGPITIALFA